MFYHGMYLTVFQLRPTPPHLTSAAAEGILAHACENESANAKRMRMGLEPLPVPHQTLYVGFVLILSILFQIIYLFTFMDESVIGYENIRPFTSLFKSKVSFIEENLLQVSSLCIWLHFTRVKLK